MAILLIIQSNILTPDNALAKQSSTTSTATDHQVQMGINSQDRQFIKTRFGIILAPISSESQENYFLLRSYSSMNPHVFHDKKLYTYSTVRRTRIGVLHAYLGNMFATNDWLIYGLNVKGTDMVHWYYSELHALNLRTGKDIMITKYHTEGGGYEFYTRPEGYDIYYLQVYPTGKGLSFGMYSYDLKKKRMSALKGSPSSLRLSSQWTLME